MVKHGVYERYVTSLLSENFIPFLLDTILAWVLQGLYFPYKRIKTQILSFVLSLHADLRRIGEFLI